MVAGELATLVLLAVVGVYVAIFAAFLAVSVIAGAMLMILGIFGSWVDNGEEPE